MKIISTLRSKQKTPMMAGALLLALALTPVVSNAANADHQGYRNNTLEHSHKSQTINRRSEKQSKHRNKGHQQKQIVTVSRYHAAKVVHRGHHKQRKGYYRKGYYAHNKHYHSADRVNLKFGLPSRAFGIVFID